MINMQRRIEEKLKIYFPNAQLQVENNSLEHKGHAGDDGSGETHFTVSIRSDEFTGLSRVKQHGMVFSALSEEVANIHSLSILIKNNP